MNETDIAIVGMAGRFPGAPDVETLWRRVVQGDDCLVDLDRADLQTAGVAERLLDDPDYVRRNGVLADVAGFDAGFFGIGDRDAAIMDPQHRHFIEMCWAALESAGHVPERFPGAIGVFAGCGMNTYMLNNLLTNPKLVEQVGMFLLRHTANDKDFLATTVSYKLDLRGPSVNVQTACSTSLVAVHLASQSLLGFECDMALAGGTTIESPHGVGYLYHEGEILAPDGHCRAFDARSAGTVLTSGVGVVALRRLADAVEDRDPILAVLKGSAVNNDGQRKVGYLAPSVDGHADVVKEALALAGLSARDIQLLEAHGTGTSVGDPIEVAALTEAFRASTSDTGFCRLVSTKPNIGHLDTAAGVASLIKVVQALRHQTLPPLANHTAPSDLLDLVKTPFTLSGQPAPWGGDAPRRAGVSSLGVGGTNAHVIVEEAPVPSPSPAPQPEQVLVLTARDADALDDAAAQLADHLESEPDINLADVAHTLVTGRRAMSHRRVIAATDVAGAVVALRTKDRNRVASVVAPDTQPRVAFMFPGGGSQYVGMASGLDDRFDTFHEVMRDGIDRVRQRSGVDLAALLLPDGDDAALRETTASLPAVFLTSLALARQWMAWGVTPDAFVGHSLGEYVAAHLAGVLTLDGAIDLVVVRSRLMGEASGAGGAMMAVPLAEQELVAKLPPALSLATINADDECVVAGLAADVAAFHDALAADDVTATMIPLSAAAHSSLLDPVLPIFLDVVKQVELSPPREPYLSNLTGTWITADQATDPQYWVDHLRHTVRFNDCLRTVLDDGPTILVELGPGHSLSSYARRQPSRPTAIAGLRHPNQAMDDTAYSLLAVARCWASGADIDLAQFAGPDRRLVRLPTYPFRRTHHWIAPGSGMVAPTIAPTIAGAPPVVQAPEPTRIPDIADWFWTPTWVEQAGGPPAAPPVGPWLVIGEVSDALVASIAANLSARGETVEVTTAPSPAVLGSARSVVLMGPTASFEEAVDRWLTTASTAARGLGAADGAPTLLAAVTRGATDAGAARTAPADAMALGVVGTAPAEYAGMRSVLVDLDPYGGAASSSGDALAVVAELFEGNDTIVARRGVRRMVPTLEHRRLPPAASSPFVRGGTYLVTGALGGVGFVLASYLAREHQANLVVVASRPVPAGDARDAWTATHSYDDATSRRIRRLRQLEAIGTDVHVVIADMADPASVVAAVDDAERLAGRLDGAVHAAGELRDRPIELATSDDHATVIGAKALGALTLVDTLRDRGAGLLLLVSSTSTVLRPEGQAAYVAANSVLDTLAGVHGDLTVRTADFGLWSGLGVAASAAHRSRLGIEHGDTVDHPVLSEIRVERDGSVHLVGTLAAEHHWLIDEHRTSHGTAVLPGTGHLELFLSAAELAGATGCALTDVSLLEPLIVRNGAPVAVRVSLGPPDGAARSIQIESECGNGTWRLHSEARVVAGIGPRRQPVPHREYGEDDIDPLARPSAQLRLGPRWASVTEAWQDGDAVAGRLALARSFQPEAGAWRAHPALADVATAFGVHLADDPTSLYVPVAYERVESTGPLPVDPWVRATRNAHSSDELLVADIAIGDDDGTVVLDLRGVTLRPIDPAALAETVLVPPDTAVLPRIAPLLALAETHGIRQEDGAEVVSRFLAAGADRLIATSLDLEDLRAFLAAPVQQREPHAASATDAAASDSSVIAVIRRIWVDLLGVDDIGEHDDFFDVGGHSLIAIRLMSRIHKDLGVRFQLATIFEASTIADIAAKVLELRPDLDDELAAAAATPLTIVPAAGRADGPHLATGPAPAPAHTSLITISPTGDRTPFFIVHGAGGNVLFLWSLARAMAGSRPIYGFQAKGVDGRDMPDATVEEMATRYVAELRAAHPGPYMLGGYSGGGIVTYEMVRQLHALGERVQYVVFFDSVPPGKAFPSRRRSYRNVATNLRKYGYEQVRPYIERTARSKIRRFVPEKQWQVANIEAEERDLGLRDVEDLGFVNLFFYFGAAADRYQMGPPIDVDAAVLKAEWIWPIHPYDYHWSEHIAGHLDVAAVPGDHDAMFYPENAPRLAEVLQPLLDRHEP